MREERVGMLQERNEYQPVVHPQVRHEVDAEHLEERARERPVDKCTEPDGDTEVGYEDLPFLMWLEQGCARNEV